MRVVCFYPNGVWSIEERTPDGQLLEMIDDGTWDPPEKGWRYREFVIEGGVSVSARSE